MRNGGQTLIIDKRAVIDAKLLELPAAWWGLSSCSALCHSCCAAQKAEGQALHALAACHVQRAQAGQVCDVAQAAVVQRQTRCRTKKQSTQDQVAAIKLVEMRCRPCTFKVGQRKKLRLEACYRRDRELPRNSTPFPLWWSFPYLPNPGPAA